MIEPEGMTIGSLVDSMGIELNLEDGALPVGAVVIVKYIDEDGVVGLHSRWSDGIAWPEKLGMLIYAQKFEMKWIDEDD